MEEVKETILADAIETAIKETKKNIKLRKIVLFQSILIVFLLILIVIGG